MCNVRVSAWEWNSDHLPVAAEVEIPGHILPRRRPPKPIGWRPFDAEAFCAQVTSLVLAPSHESEHPLEQFTRSMVALALRSGALARCAR
eukprot:10230683-Alexandrium_andersonii.AAC.1